MKERIFLWQLSGFSATSLLGTVFHFLYEWSGKAEWTAFFSGVNESTWEHMKLLFFPMFIFAVIQSFFFKDSPNYWCIKLQGTVNGLILMPILFYTYNGIIGKSPDWFNICIFFICAIISYCYEYIKFNSNDFICKYPKSAFITLCLIAVLFFAFTFITPKLGIFKDPLTGNYGI